MIKLTLELTQKFAVMGARGEASPEMLQSMIADMQNALAEDDNGGKRSRTEVCSHRNNI